jgi:D-amino-acid dehydrogenase
MRLGRWDPALWAWLARFLANCNARSVQINSERIVRVSVYSRACLQALRRDIALDYDLLEKGILTYFRNQAAFDHACEGLAASQHAGLARRRVTAAEAIALEPALEGLGSSLLGGIYSPDDESGDAFKFTQELAKAAAKRGVTFRYDCPINNFEWDKDRISGVATAQGRLRADAYVLAMGSFAPFLARQVGVSLPIYPAKGYSATFPIKDSAKCPTVSLIDEENKTVFSRLGDRLRVAGTAELAGWNNALSKVRSEKMIAHTREQFPEAAHLDKAELWAGLRPVTPDSVPILGTTRVPNLYLNSGHGTLGWTMACGAGKFITDIICGQPTDIDPNGLGLDRFQNLWPSTA